MLHPVDSPHGSGVAEAELEPLVASVEQRLRALTDSLRERDIPAIEQQAQELHRALARAVESFVHRARHGGVPEPMRLRLSHASAQLARQREAMARATAALDRAIDVLMPGEQPNARVYSSSGLTQPLHRASSLRA